MAPRGRKRKAGLKREDAARDRMRDMGFQERVINESIKELLTVYGEDHWFLIEDGSYDPLLNICLEKQEEISNQLAENQNQQMADYQNEVIAHEEQANQLAGEEEALTENLEEQKELETHVEVGSDQADTVSIPSEAAMDPSPAAFQFEDASDNYALHSVEGAENTNCGWLEEEDVGDDNADDDEVDVETNADEYDDDEYDDEEDDDDDEIIHLTPEPLCEEFEELLREARGQKERKKASK